MSSITMNITSDRAGLKATGYVTDGDKIDYRFEARYEPCSSGPGLAYPWITCIVGRENIPQRFTTYEGALNEIKTLTLRQFDLATQEQARSRVNADLKTMVEELTR